MVASLQEHVDDASLVLSVQQGEPEAFAELFRRHYPDVRRLCARRLGSVVDGDEVAQAAFVKAFERIDQCGGERRFGAWVSVIAARLCADHGRGRSRIVLGDVADEHLPRPAGPEEAVIRLEGAGEVGKVLRSLPPRQREVVIARDIEGRRPSEIAAALGVSIGAVDSLLLRARRRMASALGSGGDVGVTNIGMAAASTITTGLVASPQRAFRALADGFRTVSFHVASALGIIPGVPSAANETIAAAGVAAAALLTPFALPGPDAAEPLPTPDAIVGQVSVLADDVSPTVSAEPPAVVVDPTLGLPVETIPAAPDVPEVPATIDAPASVGLVDATVGPIVDVVTVTVDGLLRNVEERIAPVSH